MLEDQLLVRVGSRMNLTSYAERLIDPLDRVCSDLETFLTKDSFDPRTARREFVVATSDLAAYLLGRPIMDMLTERAPNISLYLIDLGSDLTSRLASREIDIALLPEFSVEDLAPAPLRFQPVFEMPRVVLMRKGHPLATKPVLLDSDIAGYKHVAFQPDRVLKSGERLMLATNGTQIDVVARVGHAMLLPKMLEGTDFVAVVPEQFADDVTALYDLESRRFPQADPNVAFGFAWSPVQDQDPSHSWFRQALTGHLSAKFGVPPRSGRTYLPLR